MVQSYFIYWAGVESPVLRDGTRQSNSKEVDGWNVFFSQQQREDAIFPGKKLLHVTYFDATTRTHFTHV